MSSEPQECSVREQLSAAEGTIVQNEEELCRQRRLLDRSWKWNPQVQLHRLVLPQHWITEEEDLCNQQRNFRVKQEEPEPPEIKEELQDLKPPQIKKEEEEPEPPQIKEELQDLKPPLIKKEEEEPEPPQIKEEPGELCISQEEEGNRDEETDPQNRGQRKRRDRRHVQSVDSSHMSAAETTTLLTTYYAGKTFSVPRGLHISFLTDSICCGIDHHIPNITAYVHPGTTLSHSLSQHMYHFQNEARNTLVIIQIGTNDVSRGLSPSTICQQMLELVRRIQQENHHVLYFAICAILPRPMEDSKTKSLIKEINHLMERCSKSMCNVVFLKTNKLFLYKGKVLSQFFKKDGLHLTLQGQLKLFKYFQKFLWHFCRHK